MTASASIVSLCNRSLGSIGARSTIASLSENSTEAIQCNIFYQPTFEQVARSARWGCLRQEAPLTLLAAAAGTPENPTGFTLPIPQQPWLYSYAEPVDCLFVRGLMPNNPQTGTSNPPATTASISAPLYAGYDGSIPFKVSYTTDSSGNPIRIILTNLTQAICVYTVNQPNPIIFDSLLEEAVVSSLAAFLVPALSLNMPLMQMAIKRAEAAIVMARTADGNETPVSQDHLPDWISARIAGSMANNGWNSQYGEYQDMMWPAGYTGTGIS
jgi:hypothetical protein